MIVDHDVAKRRYLFIIYDGDVQQCCVKEVWNVPGVAISFTQYNYIHSVFLFYWPNFSHSRVKESIMKSFPNMRRPSCGQSKCLNLVVTTWPASFRPSKLSVSNRTLCVAGELSVSNRTLCVAGELSVSNRTLCVAADSSQKSVSYFSVLEFLTGLHVKR
jgi:hypothetical protein